MHGFPVNLSIFSMATELICYSVSLTSVQQDGHKHNRCLSLAQDLG